SWLLRSPANPASSPLPASTHPAIPSTHRSRRTLSVPKGRSVSAPKGYAAFLPTPGTQLSRVAPLLCATVRNLMPAYLAGSLPAIRVGDLSAPLNDCVLCEAYLERRKWALPFGAEA